MTYTFLGKLNEKFTTKVYSATNQETAERRLLADYPDFNIHDVIETGEKITLGTWKHKKSGYNYVVTGTCIHANGGQIMVLYQRNSEKYCREYNDFLKKFEEES